MTPWLPASKLYLNCNVYGVDTPASITFQMTKEYKTTSLRFEMLQKLQRFGSILALQT